MNDKSKKSSALFTLSGCLTGDALMLFVSGALKGTALTKAQKHIAECPLCTDAVEGLRMWLKENKPSETQNELTELLRSEGSGLSGEVPVADVHSNKTFVNPINKFHTRTDILNKHIKQRLHTHAMIEANKKKRLSYKPFVWLAAAASIVILIGSFYVVWIQNQVDSENLAKQRAAELAMLESQISSDSLDVTIPANKAVLALKVRNVNGISKSVQVPKSTETEDAEVFNQDEMRAVSQVAAEPETLPAEEANAIRAESKAITPDKANAAPAGKNEKTVTMKKAEVEDQSKAVFTVVEEMPSFPGGEAERNKFLAEHIVYPKQAIESGIQGSVYLSFIVHTDGKIEDVKILRGIGGGCDEEALRVVKLMPRWNPGKQNGKMVNIFYTMPVNFKLQ
jgi:TonB family protein